MTALAYWLVLAAVTTKLVASSHWSILLALAGTILVVASADQMSMVIFCLAVGGILVAFNINWPQFKFIPPLVYLGLVVGFWVLTMVMIIGFCLRRRGCRQIVLKQLVDKAGKDTNQQADQPQLTHTNNTNQGLIPPKIM